MKKALVLGALAGQVDAVEYLRARGVETHVCAHVRSGPGVRAADRFHLADITDTRAVATLAREIGADLVYSVGSDIAMPTVVRVSEELGLPHYHGSRLTDLLRRKELLRERLTTAGLSPVRYVAVGVDDSVPDWRIFPAIVKPVDAQGQRGITVVDNPKGFREAIDQARASSLSGAAIVEELLNGPEVSAHVFVRDGCVQFFLPSDRHVWAGPLVGVPSAHSLPLRSETTARAEGLRELVEAVVTELGVTEGPLYVQAILTDRGPRIIEIASRLDGCHLWRLVRFSTGVDLMDLVFGQLLGDPWPELPSILNPRPATLEFFLGDPGMPVTECDLAAAARSDAHYVEAQVEDDGLPRRTNDVVARLGYQVYQGIS